MKTIPFIFFFLFSSVQADEIVIREVDAYGHTRYHVPGYVIEGDKIIQRDPWGHKRYHDSKQKEVEKDKQSDK